MLLLFCCHCCCCYCCCCCCCCCCFLFSFGVVVAVAVVVLGNGVGGVTGGSAVNVVIIRERTAKQQTNAPTAMAAMAIKHSE